MASSLQRMKSWAQLERNVLYWRQFTAYYKGSWWRDRYFSHKPFRKWKELEKWADEARVNVKKLTID